MALWNQYEVLSSHCNEIRGRHPTQTESGALPWCARDQRDLTLWLGQRTQVQSVKQAMTLMWRLLLVENVFQAALAEIPRQRGQRQVPRTTGVHHSVMRRAGQGAGEAVQGCQVVCGTR